MNKAGKPFRKRTSSEQKFAILSGPCGDDPEVLIKFLKQKIPEESGVAISSLKFAPVQGTPYISIEAENNEDAKNICNMETEFEGSAVLFSLTSLNDLPNYAKNFNKLIPKVVKGGHINFSSLKNKFIGGFRFNANYPPAMSSILLHAALYGRKQGMTITSINLSNNFLRNVNGFRMVKKYFPDLREVCIVGNDISEESVKNFFPQNVVFLQEAPEEKEISPDVSDADVFHSSEYSTDSDSEEDESDILAPEPPMIDFIVHKRREIKSFYKLSMFPHNLDTVREDKLYRFIKAYLECMESRPEAYSSYYADNAVLSLLISERTKERSFTEICPLTLYVDKGTNIKLGIHNYWLGSSLYEGLQYIFPYGFKANISTITTQQIDDDIYIIEMHGCCIGREGHPIPFDRTLAVKNDRCLFFITNDCINLRD